jgi:hypothetical protein
MYSKPHSPGTAQAQPWLLMDSSYISRETRLTERDSHREPERNNPKKTHLHRVAARCNYTYVCIISTSQKRKKKKKEGDGRGINICIIR